MLSNAHTCSDQCDEPGNWWELYELLPDKLRHALKEAVLDWSVSATVATFMSYQRRIGSAELALACTVARLRESDREDALALAAEYQQSWQHPLPAIAAMATPQPYGPLYPPRRARGRRLRG